MGPLQTLTSNYILNVGVLSWFIAQVLKTLLVFIPTRKIVWERMVGSGGMPSSHSALVCGVAMATAKKLGYASPEFALALALAGIVMYDAMGVRRAAGEQAKVLNRMVIDFRMMLQMLKEEMDALARGGIRAGGSGKPHRQGAQGVFGPYPFRGALRRRPGDSDRGAHARLLREEWMPWTCYIRCASPRTCGG